MKTRLVVALLLLLTLAFVIACDAGGSAPAAQTPRPTPTPMPTFTPRGQAAAPTATQPPPTPEPPTATATQPPDTPTATATPEPSPTQRRATATPRPPTPTPTPAFDYVIIEQRAKTKDENPGGMSGAVDIELYAVDKAGNPLNGVVFHDRERSLEVVSGDKGPGLATFTFTGRETYRIIVKADGSGQPLRSQETLPLSLTINGRPNELLIAAGYCSTPEECKGMGVFHVSYVIKFQRQW